MEHILSRIEFHRNFSDITTEEYVENCLLALGDAVSTRTKIYLDTKYWLILRDVSLGRCNIPNSPELLEALRKGVTSKKLICPISESTVTEILKQSDLLTLRASIQLIDELSEGICILNTEERVHTELQHFLFRATGGTPPPLEKFVWSKIGYVYGIQHPVINEFSEKELTALQKTLFDQTWQMSFDSLLELLGDWNHSRVNIEKAVTKINKENSLYKESLGSFKDAYKAEFRGYIEFFIKYAREVIHSFHPNYDKIKHQNIAIEVDELYEIQLLNFFCRAIQKPGVKQELRTLHIGALCHAAVRWDKQRKFEANDLYDFHHAEAAIGYCDAFLTEKPLRTLLLQNHLGLSKDFNCSPLATCTEALEWVLNRCE